MNPTDEQIRAAVDSALPGREITAVRRNPSPYATSHRLTDVVVEFADGQVLALLTKHLGRPAMVPAAAAIRPAFVYDPLREVDVYRDVLPGAALGTAACFASSSDPDGMWLLLEKVPGVELYQVGDVQVWQRVAAWLARAHSALSRVERGPRLIRYDAAYYAAWLQRARAAAPDGGTRMAAVARAYAVAVERLLSLPTGIVHGELYASNVLVAGNGARVCPVDWEMAAVGPGLIDLAALCTAWDDDQQRLLIDAYDAAKPDPRPSSPTDVASCQLHLCVRWLGWAQGWQPPTEHARDWMSDALVLAERLDGA